MGGRSIPQHGIQSDIISIAWHRYRVKPAPARVDLRAAVLMFAGPMYCNRPRLTGTAPPSGSARTSAARCGLHFLAGRAMLSVDLPQHRCVRLRRRAKFGLDVAGDLLSSHYGMPQIRPTLRWLALAVRLCYIAFK